MPQSLGVCNCLRLYQGWRTRVQGPVSWRSQGLRRKGEPSQQRTPPEAGCCTPGAHPGAVKAVLSRQPRSPPSSLPHQARLLVYLTSMPRCIFTPSCEVYLQAPQLEGRRLRGAQRGSQPSRGVPPQTRGPAHLRVLPCSGLLWTTRMRTRLSLRSQGLSSLSLPTGPVAAWQKLTMLLLSSIQGCT